MRLLRRSLQLTGLLLALAALLPSAARAQQQLYGTGAGGIYRISSTNGGTTLVYTGTPFAGGYVAASAQRPSDGMLFFIYGSGGNDAVYRWDPATPATAPVFLGNTGRPYMPRLAFSPGGVLYGMDMGTDSLYILNQATGAATSTGAALTGGPAGNTGGDIAVHPTNGFIYLPTGASSPYQLYRLSTTGGALTSLGNITGMPCAPAGAAFNAAGTLYLQCPTSSNLYTVALTAGAVTSLGGSLANIQDLASVPAAPPTLGKAFSPTSIGQGGTSVLTITLTNTATVPQTGAGFTDTYPANLVNAAVPGAATTCGGTVTAAAGGGSVALAGGTIPAAGSCTVSVTVTSPVTGSRVNTIAAGGLLTVLGANTAAATATLTVIPRADLQVTKTDGRATVPQGDTLTYTIVARNLGPSAVTAATISDPFPAGLGSITWTCAASGGSSCPASGSGNIAASVNLAVNGTATFTARAVATGSGLVVNTATGTPPAGVDDPAGNSSGVDSTVIVIYGVNVTPDGIDTVPRLPSTGGAGNYSYTYTLTNTSGVAEGFDLFASAGVPGAYVTVDSITGAGVTRGAAPDSARLAAIGAGSSAAVLVWYRAGAGATGALDTVLLRGRSLVKPVTARDSGWSYVRLIRPSLALAKSVLPAGTVPPGTELAYTINFSNAGSAAATGQVIVDSLPANVDFKLGSVVTNLGSTGLTAVVSYSSNNGATWTYVPVSGGGGAPAGFDRLVTNIRWVFTGSLGNSAPDNAGSLGLTARVR